MNPFSVAEFPQLPLDIKSLDWYGHRLILSDSRGTYKFKWENSKFNQTDFKPSAATTLIALTNGKLLMVNDQNVNFWDLNSFRPVVMKPIRGVLIVEKDGEGSDGFSTLDRNNSLMNWKIYDRNLVKESVFQLDHGAVVMKRLGQSICMADLAMYKLINFSTGEMITLFPYDRTANIPLITLVKDEFLLTCDGQNKILGIFITKMGDPAKGTLEWPCTVTSFVFSYPWIISSLVTNQVHIHNYLNQELVQIIDLPYNSRELKLFKADVGIKLDDSDVLSVMCVGNNAYGLAMKDLETLLSELMDSKQVTKAVALAESLGPMWDHSKFLKKLNEMYRIGAETLLHDTYFQESFDMYLRAKVEPTVVISLFPDLVSESKLSIPIIGNSLI